MTLLSEEEIGGMRDLLLETANATLTKIETPGTLTANGDPGTPVTAWTGAARGFLERTTSSELSEGIEVIVQTDTFLLLDSTGAGIDTLAAGPDWTASTVVIDDERLAGTVTRRFTVVGHDHEAHGLLDAVKLILNAGRAA